MFYGQVACDPQLRQRLLFANEDWILGFDLGFPKAKFLLVADDPDRWAKRCLISF